MALPWARWPSHSRSRMLISPRTSHVTLVAKGVAFVTRHKCGQRCAYGQRNHARGQGLSPLAQAWCPFPVLPLLCDCSQLQRRGLGGWEEGWSPSFLSSTWLGSQTGWSLACHYSIKIQRSLKVLQIFHYRSNKCKIKQQWKTAIYKVHAQQWLRLYSDFIYNIILYIYLYKWKYFTKNHNLF